MSYQNSTANTMQELVSDDLRSQENQVTENLSLPGIRELHQKPADEIAAVLANVVKSRNTLVKLEYVIGEGISVTYKTNPLNQLRD